MMPQGGVRPFTADQIEDQVALRISDTGRGIEPELLSTLLSHSSVAGRTQRSTSVCPSQAAGDCTRNQAR